MAARWVPGLHAAEAVLRQRLEEISQVWLDAQRRDGRLTQLAERFEAAGVPIRRVPRTQLDELVGDSHHQGIVVQVAGVSQGSESDLGDLLVRLPQAPLFLLLDHVQDPHNLGACLRTADATGVTGVLITKDQSVGLTPTVAKVASGAVETVPLFRVTNLARAMDRLKEAGIWIAGADPAARQTLYQSDLSGPLAIAVGAEGKGLRRLTRERCDFLVKIPLLGRVESLNLSVATAVLLYEALRQRQAVATPSAPER